MNVQNRAARVTVLPAEAFGPVPAGGWVAGKVPGRAGLFVGREAELARLDEVLAGGGGGGVVVQAVHGLGGVGKSALAARWAAARAAEFSLTWWITADSAAGIGAGLAGLGAALRPALAGSLPGEALAELAVQWLSGRRDWLVVLDNVTDPADVEVLLARAPGGRYLITSRRSGGWPGLVTPLRLGVLGQDEAAALLARIAGRDRPADAEGVAEVCRELGCLPLAVTQAGAYIAETGITAREYLGLLAGYPAEMYRSAAEGADPGRVIARIWDVTLDRLAADPLPGEVLRVLAWYAPDQIPRVLLGGLAGPAEVARACGRLAAYSMITVGPDTIGVHRLVQAVARTPDPGGPHRTPAGVTRAMHQAAAQLHSVLPPDIADPAGWPAWRQLLPHIGQLLPHIDALASHVPPAADTRTTASLLNWAGGFRLGQGAGY